MNWVIGDHGFEMYVAPELPARLRKTVGNWLASWLQRCGWPLRDIASWAVHPGGPKILHAVAESLGLTADSLQASWRVLAEYGNMSSPSVLFVLDELRRQQAQRPCVALAFGPGLTLEAALFI
jgi:predicted naringenin-chalcone synthase